MPGMLSALNGKNLNQTYIGKVISTPTPAMILLTRIVV
jgi:hypothetical protein